MVRSHTSGSFGLVFRLFDHLQLEEKSTHIVGFHIVCKSFEKKNFLGFLAQFPHDSIRLELHFVLLWVILDMRQLYVDELESSYAWQWQYDRIVAPSSGSGRAHCLRRSQRDIGVDK